MFKFSVLMTSAQHEDATNSTEPLMLLDYFAFVKKTFFRFCFDSSFDFSKLFGKFDSLPLLFYQPGIFIWHMSIETESSSIYLSGLLSLLNAAKVLLGAVYLVLIFVVCFITLSMVGQWNALPELNLEGWQVLHIPQTA